MDTELHFAGQASRIRGAVARRWRATTQRWTGSDPSRAAERAMDWLVAAECEGGLPARMGGGLACPATTAAGARVMARWGQRELAARWGERLLAWQTAEGALPDAIGSGLSPRNTALALRAFLATARVLRPVTTSRAAIERWEEGAWRAAEFLARHVDGALAENNLSTVSSESYAPSAARLAEVAALARAANHFQQVNWQRTAQRAQRCMVRTCPLLSAPLGWHASAIAEALLELEAPELARTVLATGTGSQRGDGLLPNDDGHVSAPHSLQLARLGLKFGETALADRLLGQMLRRQTPAGGFRGSWGPAAVYFPRAEATWSALEFLDCLAERVRCQFAGDAPEVARVVTAGDPVDAALRTWATEFQLSDTAEFQPKDAIAEIGAGRGRWLPTLQSAAPRAIWLAIDASPAILPSAAKNGIAIEGDLLDLPLASGSLAGALMVETLEHALLPRHAVAEMCRVIRPGGRLLIIDKPRQRQALSDHAPWERWFAPEEVIAWLARWCDETRCEPIRDSSGAEFLCWTARRKCESQATPIDFRPRQALWTPPHRAAA